MGNTISAYSVAGRPCAALCNLESFIPGGRPEIVVSARSEPSLAYLCYVPNAQAFWSGEEDEDGRGWKGSKGTESWPQLGVAALSGAGSGVTGREESWVRLPLGTAHRTKIHVCLLTRNIMSLVRAGLGIRQA